MNTVKAHNEYTRLCQEVLKANTKAEYYIAAGEALSYGNAIKDICGGQVWLEIIEAAQSLMPVDVKTVAGIPTSFRQPVIA